MDIFIFLSGEISKKRLVKKKKKKLLIVREIWQQ